MINVKHLMDPIHPDDGLRLWVEPIGLTLDLQEWCRVDHVLPALGPPRGLWEWFESHPLAYEMFRGCYHDALAGSALRPALLALAQHGIASNFTLLHQSSDPERNTATALYEFISELQAFCSPGM